VSKFQKVPPRIREEVFHQDRQRVHQEQGRSQSENDHDELGEYSVSAVRKKCRDKPGVSEVDMRGGQNNIPPMKLIATMHCTNWLTKSEDHLLENR